MVSTQIQTPKFLAGDILLFAGQGDPYSKGGAWMMRSPGEGPTYAVHMAQFLSSRWVLEMDYHVHIKSFDEVIGKPRGFEVWRCRTLTPLERREITRQALAYTRVRFGMLKFLAHMLDGLISRVAHRDVFFLRRLHLRYPVCSGITATAYDKALGYRFGVPPECVDPDHVRDWLVAHPREWGRVFLYRGSL